MGKAGKILIVLTAILVAAFAYAFVSAQLSATTQSVAVDAAQSRRSSFDSLSAALDRGDFAGVQYATLTTRDAADYAFVTYTVRLQGLNLLPAEWAVLSLTPLEGDVVLIQGAPQDIGPFGTATLSATLLTRKERAREPRALWAEYYVLGRAHSAAARGL